jgi:thiamine kinase
MLLANIIPADWQCWASSQPVVVKPLLGGLTNHSYLISTDNTLLVLRINSPISDALNLNRSAETQALFHADKAGLCASLVYSDPKQQYIVNRYLGENTWSANMPNAIAQLASLVRNIHQLANTHVQLNIEEKIAYYTTAIPTEAEFSEHLKTLGTEVQPHITTAKTLNTANVLCHNDLLASNLIHNGGKLFAIDWEYAAMGDPFYELAVIIEGNELNDEQQQTLLEEYLQRPISQQDWNRLHHWKIIYGYLCVLWYGVQYCGGAMNQANTVQEIAHQILRLKQRISSKIKSS